MATDKPEPKKAAKKPTAADAAEQLARGELTWREYIAIAHDTTT